MKHRKLTPALVLILELCTLGIIDLIFIYHFSKMLRFDKDGNVIYPMKEFILNVITFGIYGIYWTYFVNSTLDAHENQNNSATTIILTIISALSLRFIVSSVTYSRLMRAGEHITYIN